MLRLNVVGTPGGEWIRQTFKAATREIERSEPGATTVLSKMAELLFVEAVRRYVATLPSEHTGWLAGLRDPVVGRALALLHSRVAKAWTAEELARAVGLSRSAFADRFTALIGTPPMHYLASWRMQVAAHRLRDGRSPVARVAFEVGYESEAAFTRAFKRAFGIPPASWRTRGGGKAAAITVNLLLPFMDLMTLELGAPLALVPPF
jgi:transcriptional regulator GlxA family with amidase domain